MKKRIAALSFMLGGLLSMSAQQPQHGVAISLQVYNDDPTLSSHGIPRGPAIPEVTQTAHTLYIHNVDYTFTLRLIDEDGQEVYTAVIPVGTTSVVLPATLTGTYTLQLIPEGNYYFEGEIEL